MVDDIEQEKSKFVYTVLLLKFNVKNTQLCLSYMTCIHQGYYKQCLVLPGCGKWQNTKMLFY